ncbi:hypothetical protein U1Q18_046494, partial [Sarracenia purpurea var. burkii]
RENAEVEEARASTTSIKLIPVAVLRFLIFLLFGSELFRTFSSSLEVLVRELKLTVQSEKLMR